MFQNLLTATPTLQRLAGCALAVLLAAAPVAISAAPLAAVQTAEVEQRAVAPAYLAVGSVVSRYDAKIAAQTAGRVLWSAELGAARQQGEPLLQLDAADLELQRQLDEAELARLQAQRDYLDKQVTRLAQLRQRDSSSQMELDRLEAERSALQQQTVAAQVRLAQTDLALQRCEVVAPFAGVVAERLVQTGEYVSAGQAVARLVSTAQLEGSVLAPVATLRYSELGSTVAVRGDDAEQLAPISRIVPVADRVSRLVEVRVALDQAHWVVGQPLRIALAIGAPQQALTVPRDALVLREGESYVMAVDGQQQVVKVPLQLGFGEQHFVAVEPVGAAQLQPGDRVVVRGAERLRPGQQVKVLARPLAAP